jgi:hypothetical protein
VRSLERDIVVKLKALLVRCGSGGLSTSICISMSLAYHNVLLELSSSFRQVWFLSVVLQFNFAVQFVSFVHTDIFLKIVDFGAGEIWKK